MENTSGPTDSDTEKAARDAVTGMEDSFGNSDDESITKSMMDIVKEGEELLKDVSNKKRGAKKRGAGDIDEQHGDDDAPNLVGAIMLFPSDDWQNVLGDIHENRRNAIVDLPENERLTELNRYLNTYFLRLPPDHQNEIRKEKDQVKKYLILKEFFSTSTAS